MTPARTNDLYPFPDTDVCPLLGTHQYRSNLVTIQASDATPRGTWRQGDAQWPELATKKRAAETPPDSHQDPSVRKTIFPLFSLPCMIAWAASASVIGRIW
jgi:hypothetical protein